MNKLYIFLILFAAFSVSLNSQNYSTIQKALKAEKKLNYSRAIKFFKCALEDDPENEYIHYKLGKNYFNQNEYETALNHMENASPLMKDSMHYQFDMYHLYSVAGYNALAKESFIKYINLCPTCVKKDLLPGGKSNKLIYSRPIKDPQLMGYETNKTEYYPYIINDNQIQLLNVKAKRTRPTKATNFKEYLTYHYSNHDFMFFDVHQYEQINRRTGYRYGPFSMTKKLDEIYITRLDPDRETMHIYYSKREDIEGHLAWDRFVKVDIEIDKGDYNFIHPMLTEDEKHLIFSSNQPGGLGGYDLWIGEIVGKTKLINVKNLGTYVNTPGDECFPTIYDDKVMFFASDGHYGYGNLDLYAGVKGEKKGRINQTYNLGASINSADDDYALFYNHKKQQAFFTSNRFKNSAHEKSFDRIYKQSFGESKTTISVKDELNRPVSGINVSIPKENISKKTNSQGRVVANINPIGYKKVVVSGENHELVETKLSPFENRLDVVARRKLPTDIVRFSLVSHPFENPFPNAYYKITNTDDCSNYSGYTNEAGIGEVVMYADEEYTLQVPEIGYVSPKMKFKSGDNKIFVYNDLPPEVKKKSKSELEREMKANPEDAAAKTVNHTDNFTIYYETSRWNITEDVDNKMQYVIKLLNQNPSYRLELRSHTDCQGDAKVNLRLSRQRLAEAIKLFFQRGASESQIKGIYYGETKPVNNCHCDLNGNYDCSSDMLKKNRRTEVQLIRK